MNTSIFNAYINSYTTREYYPSQSVGGGLMAPGGFQEVYHTFNAPHSVGGGNVNSGWMDPYKYCC